MQFHPNLSYEDFVRGWRPSGDGKLDLVNGPFLQMINTAKDDPESEYAIIIEEINRGNPAQIFGEMLTLLESDKRNEDEALELSYRKREGERVYIPKKPVRHWHNERRRPLNRYGRFRPSQDDSPLLI